MDWKIEFDQHATKEFKKLDSSSQLTILRYLKNKVLKAQHPKDIGKVP